MAKATRSKRPTASENATPGLRGRDDPLEAPFVHTIREGIICKTDVLGHASPSSRSPAEIVVDASDGFIPLWASDVTLRWRFQRQSMTAFKDPEAGKRALRALIGEALLLWGDAVPVRFAEKDDAWDFEVVMSSTDDCNGGGCVLASAFFPDGGRHELTIYPKMFTQSVVEQVETIAHELGHVFGLRHFFANLSETAWASEIFGVHQKFSIMNYGTASTMTENDRSDLKRLYQLARSGHIRAINGTPIRLVQPFSALARTQVALPMAAVELAPRIRQERGCCRCCGGSL